MRLMSRLQLESRIPQEQEEEGARNGLALHSLKDPEIEVAKRAEALERHRRDAIEILATLACKAGVAKV